MLTKLSHLASYAVRSTGLVLVICFAAFFAASPLLVPKASGMMSLFGLWALAAAVLSWPRLPDAWRKDPPTDRQLEYAASLGIPVAPGLSKGQLSEMIKQVTGR
jgi:hypothetical protein